MHCSHCPLFGSRGWQNVSMKCQGVNSFHFASHEDFVENSHTQYSNQWPGLQSRKASVRKQVLGRPWSAGCWTGTLKIKPVLCFPSRCAQPPSNGLSPREAHPCSLLPHYSTYSAPWERQSLSQTAPLTSYASTDSVQVAFKVRVWVEGVWLPLIAQPRPYSHRPLPVFVWLQRKHLGEKKSGQWWFVKISGQPWEFPDIKKWDFAETKMACLL